MIAKISSGKDTAVLIRYLFDTKKAKDHTDPHLVASWDGFAPDPGRTDDFTATKRLLVADLDLRVKQARRLGHAPERHVWHCSLRTATTDRHLSDEEWADIARRVVAATGIAPQDDPDGCRWVAVRHAPDHIHIAATKVRGDLRPARHWNDYLTADRELATIEKEYGLLQVVRGDRTAARRSTRAEQEKAHRQGRDKSARERLRTIVRTAVAPPPAPRSSSACSAAPKVCWSKPCTSLLATCAATRSPAKTTSPPARNPSGTPAPHSPWTCPSPRSEHAWRPPNRGLVASRASPKAARGAWEAPSS